MGGAVFTPNAGVKVERTASGGQYDFKIDGGITATTMEFDFASNPGRVRIGAEAETVYQRVQLTTVTTHGGRTFRSIVELEVDNAQRYAINSWVVGSDPSAATPTTTTPPATTTTVPTGPTTTVPTGPTTTVPTGPTTTTTTTVPGPTTTTTTIPPTTTTTTTTTTIPPTGFDFCNPGSTGWTTDFGPGLWDAYHWDNRTLSGTNDAYAQDAVIDVDWGNGENTVVGESDDFSILWRQQIEVATTCTIEIRAGGDDGYAVNIDGDWKIVEWRNQSFNQETHTITLDPGFHDFDFYFYENSGFARALLEWRTV
jgi:hypothetical protein